MFSGILRRTTWNDKPSDCFSIVLINRSRRNIVRMMNFVRFYCFLLEFKDCISILIANARSTVTFGWKQTEPHIRVVYELSIVLCRSIYPEHTPHRLCMWWILELIVKWRERRELVFSYSCYAWCEQRMRSMAFFPGIISGWGSAPCNKLIEMFVEFLFMGLTLFIFCFFMTYWWSLNYSHYRLIHDVISFNGQSNEFKYIWPALMLHTSYLGYISVVSRWKREFHAMQS